MGGGSRHRSHWEVKKLAGGECCGVLVKYLGPLVHSEGLWSSQKPQMMNLLTGGQKLCADCHVLIWLCRVLWPTCIGVVSVRALEAAHSVVLASCYPAFVPGVPFFSGQNLANWHIKLPVEQFLVSLSVFLCGVRGKNGWLVFLQVERI